MWYYRPMTSRQVQFLLVAEVLIAVLFVGGIKFVRYETNWCQKITNEKIYNVCIGR